MRNVAAAVLLLLSPAVAGTSAGFGMGGKYARFDPVVSQYNQSGELFRIEGHCQSSCTLFLATGSLETRAWTHRRAAGPRWAR
jgi:hypothetical protein